jgi:hypothetical protein
VSSLLSTFTQWLNSFRIKKSSLLLKLITARRKTGLVLARFLMQQLNKVSHTFFFPIVCLVAEKMEEN